MVIAKIDIGTFGPDISGQVNLRATDSCKRQERDRRERNKEREREREKGLRDRELYQCMLGCILASQNHQTIKTTMDCHHGNTLQGLVATTCSEPLMPLKFRV